MFFFCLILHQTVGLKPSTATPSTAVEAGWRRTGGLQEVKVRTKKTKGKGEAEVKTSVPGEQPFPVDLCLNSGP